MAYEEYRKDKNNESLKENFKRKSTELKREVRKAEISYYSKLLEENVTNPREYWNIINKVRGDRDKQNIAALEIDNMVINVDENPKDAAEAFNKYLSDSIIFTKNDISS